MKATFFLVLLMSATSAFAETMAVPQEQYPYANLAQTAQADEDQVALIRLMREFYEWNGPFSEEELGRYVIQAHAVGSSSGRPGRTMLGINPYDFQNRGARKWGPCTSAMLSDTPHDGWPRTPGGRYRNPAYMIQPGGVACARR